MKSLTGPVRIIKSKEKAPKSAPEKFPWPRFAEDGHTPLGVDVKTKKDDIIKIVHKFFRIKDFSMEDLLQEVFLTILHKNTTKSAHDPRKSSFGHYIFMIANNVCVNLVYKKNRYDKEQNSIDAPMFGNPISSHDSKTIAETYEDEVDKENIDFSSNLEKIEEVLRCQGCWELARYMRMVRSGASPDIIREALSHKTKKYTHKNIRDIRSQLEMAIVELNNKSTEKFITTSCRKLVP